MLLKIVSGGQNGADQAGLKVAKKLGIATGGWIPRGFKTEYGLDPSLAQYGLVETENESYYPRTVYNVRDSEATVYFASNWNSPGTKATLRAVHQFQRPVFKVDLKLPPPYVQMSKWLNENKVKILNVAGHRESVHPGVGNFVEEYLTQVIKLYHEYSFRVYEQVQDEGPFLIKTYDGVIDAMNYVEEREKGPFGTCSMFYINGPGGRWQRDAGSWVKVG